MEFLQFEWQSAVYEQALALRDRLLRRPLGLRFSQEDLSQESRHWHFGLVDQEQLIACVVIVPLDDQRAKLRQMVVDEPWQRSGHGAALIRQTESNLVARGIKDIELNAREPVIGFYESLGYRPEGLPFIEVTITHQKMVKELA